MATVKERRFVGAGPLLAGLLLAGLAGCSAGDGGTRASGIERGAEPGGTRAADNAAAVAAPAAELIPLRVGGIEIRVELADDAAERQQGLMFRESLAENQGMLFAYPDERTLGFWMKNTLIPLDIAYIDAQGRIVDIQQMEPQTTETHNSSAPAMYALEMNQGWFEANGIRVGDLIEF